MRLVIAATPAGLLTGAVSMPVLAFVVSRYGQLPPALVLVYCLGYLAASAFSITSVRHYDRVVRTASDAIRFRPRYALAAALHGGWFGTLAWFGLPIDDPHLASFATASGTLILFGAVTELPHRPLLLAFVVPNVVVFTAGLLRFGGVLHAALAVLFVAVAALLVSLATLQEEALRAAVRLEFESAALLRERTLQQQATDHARAEAERALAAAERADRGKTSFLAAASHDLRQPMHALVQYVGLLQMRNRDPELEATIARVDESLGVLQELLDSILEVSKLMMGAIRPEFRAVPIEEVLQRIDLQMRPIADAKGLSFAIVHEGAIVRTDHVLLERVLGNLALNAITYTPRGHVLLRCRRRGKRLRVQVWDTGSGIARADRERIFEEFYQVANEARDRRKGLGLGLALARQLCGLLGHELVVRSRLGRGSLFSVDMPIAEADIVHPGAPDPRPAPDYLRGAQVVVIDDDATCLESTAEALRQFGCHVLAASSSAQAIERLEASDFMPQLIVSDYRLSGDNGIAAIAKVLANRKAAYGDELGCAAFLVSGDTAPGELKVVQEAGYTMLHKPVRVEQLYDVANRKLSELATSAA